MTCALPILHDAVGCDCTPPTEREMLRQWVRDNPGEALVGIRGERARRSLAEFFRQAFTQAIEPSTPYEHGPHVDAICDHIQWQLEERARAVADRGYMPACPDLLINMPPRALKPCYENGMVITKARGLIRLADVQVGDMILTHQGRFRRVTAVHRQGVLPLWEITTGRGRVVKVAGDHPMLTQRGWVRADEVTTRDVLAEVHAVEPGGAADTPHHEARMLGYLVGDGCLSNPASTRFTNQDPLTLDDFEHCARTLRFATRRTATPSRAKDVILKSSTSSWSGRKARSDVGPVRAWVRAHGLEGATSYTKRVPRAVMEADEATVAEYLAAYWACDGGIHDRRDLARSDGGTSTTVRIDATTVSEGLARDHQALLNRLGLSFALRRKVTALRTKRQGERYISWHLVAQDQDTAAKFMQTIGVRIRHEKATRAAGLTRTAFDRVLVADPVVAVQQQGSGECRCLTVDEDHSFVYEGVAVHNTIIIQVAAVAWAWLHWPELRILCLSTNPKVSTEAADQCRALIRSEWYQTTFQPEWQIRDDKDGVTDMKNTAGGRRAARGLDANFVGEGGDWRIVDDPNDPDDVYSDVKRQAVERRWRNSIANRKTDPRTTITTGIQQRTHVDDWSAARILEGWVVLKLRQEFDPRKRWNTPMPVGNDNRLARGHASAHRWQDWRTREGETLHPRFTPEWCAGEKAPTKLGVLGFSAQHNQEPRLLEGGLFKRAHWRFFRFEDDPPVSPERRPDGCTREPALTIKRSDLHWQATSTDATFGKSDTSDRVGLLVARGLEARTFIEADLTERRTFPETLKALHNPPPKDGPPPPDYAPGLAQRYPFASHLIEKKANGQAVIDTLEGTVAGMIDIEPVGGKQSRAQACAPTVEAGCVYLHDGAEWLEDFVAELADFPDGKHDDRVDSLTQMLIHYATARSAFWYA